jgi:hypothetical protein
LAAYRYSDGQPALEVIDPLTHLADNDRAIGTVARDRAHLVPDVAATPAPQLISNARSIDGPARPLLIGVYPSSACSATTSATIAVIDISARFTSL